MSQLLNDKEKEVLIKASVYQNKSTSLESDQNWSDLSEASDAENDQLESLNDIFGSPTTIFEQDYNFTSEDKDSDTDEFSSDGDWDSDSDEFSSDEDLDEELKSVDQFFDENFGNPCTLFSDVTETPVIENVVNCFSSLNTKHGISSFKKSKSSLNETHSEKYHEVRVATKVCSCLRISVFRFYT